MFPPPRSDLAATAENTPLRAAEQELPLDAPLAAPLPDLLTATLVPPDPAETALPPTGEIPSAPVKTIWRPRSWPIRLWHALGRGGVNLFGWLSLMVGLALLATLPLAQFISLGYLLECSGRVARSGRLRDGLIDLDRWARMGGLVAGTYLMLLPLYLVSDFAHEAELIAPGSITARNWRLGLRLLSVVVVGHILLAWYSGGKLRHFFWPLLAPFSLVQWVVTRKVVGPLVRPAIRYLAPNLADDLDQPAPLASWFPPAILLAGLRRGPTRMYAEARDAAWDFVVSLHLPHYFWLGLRGFLGALAWLFLPVLLLIGSTKIANGGLAFLVGISGALALATVLLYLPFLQAHFAAENRWRAMFELRIVRRLFQRAPIAFWFALLLTLALALPLYLFKIQKVYEEFEWAMSLFFVFFAYPARLLTGWAVGLANHRKQPRFFLFRWASRLAAVPVCLIYVLFVYLSQYTSWYGSWSLFEQHLFLVPVPFFGG
jgi:hypothetical protein